MRIKPKSPFQLCIFILLSLNFARAAEPNYALDDPYPLAQKSYYSMRILKYLKHWPIPEILINEEPVFLRAIQTPNYPDTIGMIKHLVIKSPLSKVSEVIEKFQDYPKIWRDLVTVTVQSQDRNRTITAWVRKSPVFFVPNLHYRMLTVCNRTKSQIVYKHQLIDGNALTVSDALLILDAIAEDQTRVSVLNFLEPSLGAFKTIIGGNIWKLSLQSSYKEDIAFIARMEHPDWNLDQISSAAEEALNKNPIETIKYIDPLPAD